MPKFTETNIYVKTTLQIGKISLPPFYRMLKKPKDTKDFYRSRERSIQEQSTLRNRVTATSEDSLALSARAEGTNVWKIIVLHGHDINEAQLTQTRRSKLGSIQQTIVWKNQGPRS